MILLSVLRILIYACSVVICVRVIIKRTSFSSASYSVRAINDSSVGIYKYCILSKYGIIIDVPINICDLVLLFHLVSVSRSSSSVFIWRLSMIVHCVSGNKLFISSDIFCVVTPNNNKRWPWHIEQTSPVRVFII